MVDLRPVTDLHTPELAPYRTMRRQLEQREQGIFVAEGEKVVRRLLESAFEVISLLLPQKWYEQYSDLIARRPESQIEVFIAEKELLEKLTGFTFYQGVLAVGRVPKVVSLEQVIDHSPTPRLFVALDEISNAPNMGGLIRSCVALGVNALVVGETCCSPYLRRSVRSSMGTIFKLPIVESTDLRESIKTLKRKSFRTIAAHAHTEQQSVSKIDFSGDSVIVLGNEEKGISARVLELCDERAVIPMQNEIDSLNVGIAGAIFLYEASRQRGMA